VTDTAAGRSPPRVVSVVMKPRPESSSTDPLEASPPRFSHRAAECAAAHFFGVSGALTALDSERDQKFKVVTPGGESYPCVVREVKHSLRD
jgi:hypothetical protein